MGIDGHVLRRQIREVSHHIWFGEGGQQMGAKWYEHPCIVNEHSRFFVENVFEELDAPGEWHLGRDGTLTYKPLPGEDLAKADVWAPVTAPFVRIVGEPALGIYVEHIALKGLAFRHGQYLVPPEGHGDAQAAHNIEGAIKRATGKDAADITEIHYEGKGPHGSLFVIECATDNTNRSVTNLRTIFNKNGGQLVQTGSLDFLFNRKAVVEFEASSDLDLAQACGAQAAPIDRSDLNGDGAVDDETTEPPTGTIEEQVIELLARADQAFAEAEEAIQSGDLVTWAQKIEEAQAAIEAATSLLTAANEPPAEEPAEAPATDA